MATASNKNLSSDQQYISMISSYKLVLTMESLFDLVSFFNSVSYCTPHLPEVWIHMISRIWWCNLRIWYDQALQVINILILFLQVYHLPTHPHTLLNPNGHVKRYKYCWLILNFTHYLLSHPCYPCLSHNFVENDHAVQTISQNVKK
jgi:hypothetical protein